MNTDLKEDIVKEEFKSSTLIRNANKSLILKFDLGIIELLGSQLYTRLPSIISEFVSNSYDADATKVAVVINENDLGPNKITNIIIKDNGTGIASSATDYIEEINNNFLSIGRKRRKVENTSES